MSLNMNNYSPNMLKTFDECQRKFFLKYVQKLSVPQRSSIFEKGKKIHALANYYLNGENIEKMEKVLSVDEKIAWETLKSSKYFNLQVVDTEYNLSCKIGKYWVGGRLDAFMSTNDPSSAFQAPSPPRGEGLTPNFSTIQPFNSSTFVILDYKTGNIPKNAQQDFQTIVYLLCADKFLKSKGGYNSLKFVYLGLKKAPHPNPPPQGWRGQAHEEEILLTQDLKKQYEEKIVSTCEKIDFAVNSNVFSKNIEGCKFCEYCKICK